MAFFWFFVPWAARALRSHQSRMEQSQRRPTWKRSFRHAKFHYLNIFEVSLLVCILHTVYVLYIYMFFFQKLFNRHTHTHVWKSSCFFVQNIALVVLGQRRFFFLRSFSPKPIQLLQLSQGVCSRLGQLEGISRSEEVHRGAGWIPCRVE